MQGHGHGHAHASMKMPQLQPSRGSIAEPRRQDASRLSMYSDGKLRWIDRINWDINIPCCKQLRWKDENKNKEEEKEEEHYPRPVHHEIVCWKKY